MNVVNSSPLGLRVAGTLFGLMSLGHLGRLLWQFPVNLAGHAVPVWLNAIGFLATGALCVWLWRLSWPRDTTPKAPLP